MFGDLKAMKPSFRGYIYYINVSFGKCTNMQRRRYFGKFGRHGDTREIVARNSQWL